MAFKPSYLDEVLKSYHELQLSLMLLLAVLRVNILQLASFKSYSERGRSQRSNTTCSLFDIHISVWGNISSYGWKLKTKY